MKLSPAVEGNLAAFVGSCLLGAAVVATRQVVDEIAPLNLAFLRYALGGACLAALVQLIRPGSLRLPREALPKIALLGVLMYALFPVLFNTSLRYTTASRGAVILALMPLFTAVLGAFARSEQLKAMQWLGVVCSIAGVAAVFAESGLGFADGRSAMMGNALMVLAALVGRGLQRGGAADPDALRGAPGDRDCHAGWRGAALPASAVAGHDAAGR